LFLIFAISLAIYPSPLSPDFDTAILLKSANSGFIFIVLEGSSSSNIKKSIGLVLPSKPIPCL